MEARESKRDRQRVIYRAKEREKGRERWREIEIESDSERVGVKRDR